MTEEELLELPVDTKVLVWEDGENKKYRRYMSHYDKRERKLHTFQMGCTSWSSEVDYTIGWNNWEIIEG